MGCHTPNIECFSKSGDKYVFPAWLNSLIAGKSFDFVYIHSAPPADVSVLSYSLA